MLTFKQFLLEGNKLSRLLSGQKDQKYLIAISVEKSPAFFYPKDVSKEEKAKINNKVSSQNAANTKQFRAELARKKIGYIPVKGVYPEEVNGTTEEVYENSSIITATDFWPAYRLAKHWAIKTRQDTILLASNGEGILEYTRDFVDSDGVEHSIGDVYHIGKLNLHNINNMYTLLKDGKQFSYSNSEVSHKVEQFFNK